MTTTRAREIFLECCNDMGTIDKEKMADGFIEFSKEFVVLFDDGHRHSNTDTFSLFSFKSRCNTFIAGYMIGVRHFSEEIKKELIK